MARIASNGSSRVYTSILDDEEKPIDADGDVTFTSVYSLTGTPGPSGTAIRATVGSYYAKLTAQMDPALVLTFEGTVDGDDRVWTETVEVVGKRMFTLQELRASDASLANKSYVALSNARDVVEAVFENETGQAFVPRTKVSSWRTGYWGEELWLQPNLIAIDSVTVADVVTSFEASEQDGRAVTLDVRTLEPVELVYRYGRSTEPDVKRAALTLAREVVLGSNSRLDDRAYALTIPDVGTVNLSTPGQRGARTGLPEVDVVLDKYDIRETGIV